MDKLHLPQWHSPEHVRDILLALPEKKRNRALYELVWQFDHLRRIRRTWRDAAQRGHARNLCRPHDCPEHRKRTLHRPLLSVLERTTPPPAPRF